MEDINLSSESGCGDSGFADSYKATEIAVADVVAEAAVFAAFRQNPPIPLPGRSQYPEYPLDALGPVLGPAAERIAYYVQCPLALAGQSVLAVSGLVTQPIFDVNCGPVGICPTSLYCISIAGSGDRKSAVDKLALKPVREFELQRSEATSAEWKAYRSEKEAWDAHKKAVEKLHKPDDQSSFDDKKRQQLVDALMELEANKPSMPIRPNILFSEPTPEGIWKHFEEGLPGAGLFSDEGIGFFGGHGMSKESQGRMIAQLSHLWGGDTLTRTRAAQGESGVLIGRRLSAHLMMQPVVAQQVFDDQIFVGQGFIPRFLTAAAESKAGTRFLSNRPLGESPNDDPSIQEYWAVISKMVAHPPQIDTQTGALQLITLEIYGASLECWQAAHDRIEREMGPNGRYADIKAFASKAGENIARMAAVFSAVEGGIRVTVQHIQNAEKLMSYYLEVIRAMTDVAQEDKNDLLAGEMLDWLKINGSRITAYDFKRLPSKLRNAKAARRALGILTEYGYVKVTRINELSSKPCEWEVIDHG